jgi:HEAT repeat protein
MSLDALENIAFNTDMQTSIWAAEQLTRMEPDVRLFEVLTRLMHASNPLVAQMAIKRLEGYGGMAVESLLDALGKCSPMIQISITCTLERIGSRKAVEPLMAALAKAEYPSLRYTIIHALGTLGDPAAIDLIRSFAEDADHHVRQRVQTALESFAATAKD